MLHFKHALCLADCNLASLARLYELHTAAMPERLIHQYCRQQERLLPVPAKRTLLVDSLNCTQLHMARPSYVSKCFELWSYLTSRFLVSVTVRSTAAALLLCMS